jgi:hypothetical protein
VKQIASDDTKELLCPSSQPGVEGALVLGVIQPTHSGPRVAYLDELLPASGDVLALAAPLHPTEVYRLAAKCQTSRCPHFDGNRCGLATRLVQILPEAVEALPNCQIRPQCRWFQQEGRSACRRCPEITTVNYDPSQAVQRVIKLRPEDFLAQGHS